MQVILMMAITLDGKIAKHSGHNADWTSKADKKFFVAKTKEIGTIIMGKTTFQVMGARPLPSRLNVILDSPENINPANNTDELLYLSGTPEEVVSALEAKGITKAILGGGAYTNGQWLAANLIDEIMVTVEPKLFCDGLSLFSGISNEYNLELISSDPIGDGAVVLRYKILKG